MRACYALLVAFAVATVAFAQTTTGTDTSFQVRYAANLQYGESFIDIINTGANGATALGPGLGVSAGNICVNVYAFDAEEELIACCSCVVTPDEVVSLGVNRDLTSHTLTGRTLPVSVTVKLLSTIAGVGGTNTTCVNSAALSTSIVGGMAAWGTTLHTTPTPGQYATTETPFTPATLSQGELASIQGRCAFIIGNGAGFGTCASCRIGALGSQKQ